MTRILSLEELNAYHPDFLDPTPIDLVEQYRQAVSTGTEIWKTKKVVFAGLARNIELGLNVNIPRLAETISRCLDWRFVVYENDSTDKTRTILNNLQFSNQERISILGTDDGQPDLRDVSNTRISRMVRYRSFVQSYIRSNYPDFDLVVIIDLDLWGGWSVDGLMTALAWGDFDVMASFSQMYDSRGWIHYDRWAFKFNSWTEEWALDQSKYMNWFWYWKPPRGSKPIPCLSAFGSMSVYKMEAYLAGIYNSNLPSEINNIECVEHSAFHYELNKKGFKKFFLNPSQRCTVSW